MFIRNPFLGRLTDLSFCVTIHHSIKFKKEEEQGEKYGD
jgi:hypothetical protein